MGPTQFQQLHRAKKQYDSLVRERDAALEKAERAKVTTGGTNVPLWTDVLLPMLTKEVETYEKIYAWHAEGTELERRRGAAMFARILKDEVLSTVGNRDIYLAEAEKFQSRIAELETAHPQLKGA